MAVRGLRVDLDLCEAYGNCVFEADDYFDLSDGDKVNLLRTEVGNDDLERVELAVASCPVAALSFDDE